ncbi:MAG: hypothetical protein HY898_32650 [Deltaproteobacteria bacterium]|nr:hypothetical protein [Deltaproteobacteria bacterium]
MKHDAHARGSRSLAAAGLSLLLVVASIRALGCDPHTAPPSRAPRSTAPPLPYPPPSMTSDCGTDDALLQPDAAVDALAAQCSPVHVDLPELIPASIDVPVPPVVDPAGSMAHFHERMASLLRGQARDHVRIGVFGDSNMTMDWITGEMRRVLQARYGDAGHGYVALARPWEWYRHMDVKAGHDPRDWTPFAVSTHQADDQCYGFAGIAARSERAGAITWVATADPPAPIGTHASRFGVYYLRKPRSGPFDIQLDGRVVASLTTDHARIEAGYYAWTADDAPHKVEFISRAAVPTVLFGVTLERAAPGVVIDSLGIGAVSGPLLLRQNREVMRGALRARRYDLIVLLLGSNQVWPVRYVQEMTDLIARLRDALPEVSILVTTPVDRIDSMKAWRSVPGVREVSIQNRKVAEENRCAFWDFRGAMGGEASMLKFVLTNMAGGDGIHLTQKGASYMGRRTAYAIWRDLEGYLSNHPAAGCSPGASESTAER